MAFLEITSSSVLWGTPLPLVPVSATLLAGPPAAVEPFVGASLRFVPITTVGNPPSGIDVDGSPRSIALTLAPRPSFLVIIIPDRPYIIRVIRGEEEERKKEGKRKKK